jgi:hypothetical protein
MCRGDACEITSSQQHFLIVCSCMLSGCCRWDSSQSVRQHHTVQSLQCEYGCLLFHQSQASEGGSVTVSELRIGSQHPASDFIAARYDTAQYVDGVSVHFQTGVSEACQRSSVLVARKSSHIKAREFALRSVHL